jgi:hypothetical protein
VWLLEFMGVRIVVMESGVIWEAIDRGRFDCQIVWETRSSCGMFVGSNGL